MRLSALVCSKCGVESVVSELSQAHCAQLTQLTPGRQPAAVLSAGPSLGLSEI